MSAVIQIHSLCKRYGSLVVLDEARVTFHARDKIGVIGRNGSGKTTLCRLLLGQEEPDSGEIAESPRLRLGYLEQQDPFQPGETVLSFLQRVSGKERWECGKIAGRFHLKNDLLSLAVSVLPGGYQTRVKLAAMLLQDPNFLILDEPTNHLDLRTLLLLERFLREFSGGFLIVSHDREFLKRTCESTLEVDRGDLTLFPGDVESYLAFREEQREHDSRVNRNLESRRKQIQDFIDRNRVRASTAARAQSRIKQLERMHPIEIGHPIRSVRIRVPRVERKTGMAVRVTDLEIGYPGKRVAGGIRLEIERGARVAVLGDNGQGKSTFLRTLAGQLPPLGGDVQWGSGLTPACYAQHVYGAMDPGQTVLSHLEGKASAGTTRQEILDTAGSFLFRGDEVQKSVAVLSGGERARLCLAGLLLGSPDVLLLDEPTNHLDFETVEALGTALRTYAGTILFVSHDRTFVSLVATSVVEVKDGAVTFYPGDYALYVYRAEKEAEEDEAPPAAAPAARSAPKRREGGGNELRKEIRRIEKRMSQAQAEQEAIHSHYLENPTDTSRDKPARLAVLKRQLEEDEARWLELHEELEAGA